MSSYQIKLQNSFVNYKQSKLYQKDFQKIAQDHQMQFNNNHIEINPEQFIISIKDFSFQQRFFKWQSYIKQLKQSQSPFYQLGLERFIQNYPFNSTYWIMLIEHILTKPKSKAGAVRMYQIALTKNSRSIDLWRNYLMWLKQKISKSDPNYLRGQFEKATKIIGTHYHADFIFQQYFNLQTDVYKKIQSMKKALVSPLKQIDRIFDLIVTYIDQSQQLTVQILENIAKNQQLTISTDSKITNLSDYILQIKQKVKQLLRKLYQPTKKHVELRYQYEAKLSQSDQYRPFEGCYEVWKNYLYFIKNSGNLEFVYPLYERALIALCDKESLWEDYFLILQSQGNYNRALYLLRSHSTFFENLSREITYYWLEIQERQNPQKARQLYIQLQKHQNHLQAFMRHIQLELRAKQFHHAKTLYETILTVFTSNINIIAYIVIEYAQFMIKYFRDIQFSKKLLKTYFQSSPYNEYLFLNYLQFFIKHVEYRENLKDGKQVYDEFLSVLCNGLSRALDNTPNKYQSIKKSAIRHLRDYITSIYSIKGAQKKIKQMQLNAKKNANQSLKRAFEE